MPFTHSQEDDDEDRKPAAQEEQEEHKLDVHDDANNDDDNNTDENNNTDEDDDEDNWSRQVETDEASAHYHLVTTDTTNIGTTGSLYNATTMESVAEDESVGAAANAVPHPPPPVSLKQEAILRERQRRIETERARLKRQFALSTQQQQQQQQQPPTSPMTLRTLQVSVALPANVGDSASIAETIESTMVHPDEENAENPEMRLGFNMERFLRNSADFQPPAEQDANAPTNGQDGTNHAGNNNQNATSKDDGPPILMERFINQPVVVDPPPSLSFMEDDDEERQLHQANDSANVIPTTAADDTVMVQRSVSFEAAAAAAAETQHPSQNQQLRHPQSASSLQPQPPTSTGVPSATYSSFEEDTTTNVSIQVHPDDDEENITSHHPDDDVVGVGVGGDDDDDNDDRRGLTEADVRAMVATEEASIANAPPSDRDELLSEVGELADFASAGAAPFARPDFSVGTPTTAVESVSKGDGAPSSSAAETSDRQSINTDTPSSPVGRPGTPPTSNLAAAAAAAVAPPLSTEPSSPQVTQHHHHHHDDGFTPWSPPGKMQVSPLQQHQAVITTAADRQIVPPLVGVATQDEEDDAQHGGVFGTNGVPPPPPPPPPPSTMQPILRNEDNDHHHHHHPVSEVTPLLGVPPEIITTRNVPATPEQQQQQQQQQTAIVGAWNHLQDAAHRTRQVQTNAAAYATQTKPLWRAWPARGLALMGTWLVAMPVLVLVSHVLHRGLCTAAGVGMPLRSVVLWMALLPVTLMATRHIQSQTSRATYMAIQYAHLTPDTSFGTWWRTETAAAALLGLQNALAWGVVAGLLGQEVRLAVAVALAQWVTSVLAGMIGSCMPLVTTFALVHVPSVLQGSTTDETDVAATLPEAMVSMGSALQDLVGTVVWWLLSYYLFAVDENENDNNAAQKVQLGEGDRMASFCA